jgi:hypothetical protein
VFFVRAVSDEQASLRRFQSDSPAAAQVHRFDARPEGALLEDVSNRLDEIGQVGGDHHDRRLSPQATNEPDFRLDRPSDEDGYRREIRGDGHVLSFLLALSLGEDPLDRIVGLIVVAETEPDIAEKFEISALFLGEGSKEGARERV